MLSANLIAEAPLLNTDVNPDPTSASRLMTFTAALLAVALLLWFHPYRGIWHDSAIYAGQTLALLFPEPFRLDLFFAYGSQAKFSLFPNIIASLTQVFGLGSTFLWLTLFGLLAFLLASWQLLRQLLPVKTRYPGLLALILLPTSYGAWGILSYAEPFLTGRSFAEPLILASLAALIGNRLGWSLILGLAATAIHPLQALPAGVVSWLWLIQQDRRWLRLAWLAPIALIIYLLLPQLHFLAARMDPLWFQQVWQRNLVVFYSHSSASDWSYLLKDVFVTAIAAHVARQHLRHYLLAVLGASLLLFFTGLILADGLHLVWPAGLQLWRVHWLLHWTATAVLPWLCMCLWQQHTGRWPRLLVFASTVILGLMPVASPLLPAIAFLYLSWSWLAVRIGPPLQKLMALSCGLLALNYLLPELLALTPWGFPSNHTRWMDALQQPRLPAALFLTVPLSALWVARRYAARLHWMAAPLLVAALLPVAYRWDQRSDLQRAFTGLPLDARPFGTEIAPDAQVVWLGNLLPAWSVLHRPYYIQQQQLSGIVFNRATSIEGYRRKELMHVQDGHNQDCRIVVFPKEPYPACKPDDAAVRQACRNAQGALSYFILYYPLRAIPRGIWSPNAGTTSTYYLYACQDFMKAAPAAVPVHSHQNQHAPSP